MANLSSAFSVSACQKKAPIGQLKKTDSMTSVFEEDEAMRAKIKKYMLQKRRNSKAKVLEFGIKINIARRNSVIKLGALMQSAAGQVNMFNSNSG